MSSIINKIFSKDEENKQAAKPAAKVNDDKKETKSAVKKTVAKTSTKVKKEDTVVSAVKVKKQEDNEAYKILQAPVITEKATDLAMLNKYLFKVPVSASKSQVVNKIMNVYGVKPVKVNMVKMLGKKVRHGRKFGHTKDWKKAIVTLAPEDKIEIYEGV